MFFNSKSSTALLPYIYIYIVSSYVPLSVKEKVTHNTDYGRVCTLLEKRLNI